jgi:hypothetical protein
MALTALGKTLRPLSTSCGKGKCEEVGRVKRKEEEVK